MLKFSSFWLTFGQSWTVSRIATGDVIISIISMNSLHPIQNFYSRSSAAGTCMSFYMHRKELLWVACRNVLSLHRLHRLLDAYSCSQVFFHKMSCFTPHFLSSYHRCQISVTLLQSISCSWWAVSLQPSEKWLVERMHELYMHFLGISQTSRGREGNCTDPRKESAAEWLQFE